MHPLNKKTWAGFAFVSLCTLLCCLYPIVGWDLPETALGGADPDCFLAVVLFAYLVLLAGVILLLRGKPAGGIVGAMGSVAFLPVGLLTLIGCLQCRKRLRQMEAPAGAARGTAALGQLSPVLWLGLALCVLSFITYLSMGTESGGVDTAVSTFLLAGLLLSLAGMILLACGKPLGGIVGAVGSLCCVPLGLVFLIGCIQSRDRLLDGALPADEDMPEAVPAKKGRRAGVAITAWVGLAFNLLNVALIVYAQADVSGCNEESLLSFIYMLAFAGSLTGVVLLARGNAAGGIVGAVSSACVIPLGAICLVGCMVSRDRLRRAARAAARDAVHDPSAGQEDPGREDLDPKEPV